MMCHSLLQFIRLAKESYNRYLIVILFCSDLYMNMFPQSYLKLYFLPVLIKLESSLPHNHDMGRVSSCSEIAKDSSALSHSKWITN